MEKEYVSMKLLQFMMSVSGCGVEEACGYNEILLTLSVCGLNDCLHSRSYCFFCLITTQWD